MKQTAKIAIIGTGFSGLGMAIKLKEAGFDDFVILEQSDNVGGTWHAVRAQRCEPTTHAFIFERGCVGGDGRVFRAGLTLLHTGLGSKNVLLHALPFPLLQVAQTLGLGPRPKPLCNRLERRKRT